MKTLLIILFVLVGCTHHEVAPTITGHWYGTGIGPSDEVIVLDFTFGANYSTTGTYTINNKSTSILQSSVYKSIINPPQYRAIFNTDDLYLTFVLTNASTITIQYLFQSSTGLIVSNIFTLTRIK